MVSKRVPNSQQIHANVDRKSLWTPDQADDAEAIESLVHEAQRYISQKFEVSRYIYISFGTFNILLFELLKAGIPENLMESRQVEMWMLRLYHRNEKVLFAEDHLMKQKFLGQWKLHYRFQMEEEVGPFQEILCPSAWAI